MTIQILYLIIYVSIFGQFCPLISQSIKILKKHTTILTFILECSLSFNQYL